jgi:hypothetical protein
MRSHATKLAMAALRLQLQLQHQQQQQRRVLQALWMPALQPRASVRWQQRRPHAQLP